jgi:uncharacterized protein with NRDE domain
MCLLLVALDAHPFFKLVLAANRDEFYDRPTAPPSFWQDAPDLLAGRDLAGGGTWLGITRHGRIAATTNYRDPSSFKKAALSRGKLVTDFLLGKSSPPDYLESIRREAGRYNGFNLLVGERDHLHWTSNRSDRIVSLSTGIHGVSNRLLNTPWPKVVRGKELLASVLRDHARVSPESLFALLRDRHQPPDEALPSTGVRPEWERVLAPIFIKSPDYGTRSSTVLLIDKNDHLTFMDRTFNGRPEPVSTARFEFDLES